MRYVGATLKERSQTRPSANLMPVMDVLTTHSFVIRLWLEEVDRETSQAQWRGHVTHVISRRRRYIENLEEIEEFISGCLESRNTDINH